MMTNQNNLLNQSSPSAHCAAIVGSIDSFFPTRSSMSMRKILTALSSVILLALSIFTQHVQAEEFLDPEVAFKVNASAIDTKTVQVRFLIANGYYLYRERVKIEAVGATLGEVKLPAGKIKFDETFQKEVETYRKELIVKVPYTLTDAKAKSFTLKLNRQGCADAGLCYPPLESELTIDVSKVKAAAEKELANPVVASSAADSNAVGVSAASNPSVTSDALASNAAAVSASTASSDSASSNTTLASTASATSTTASSANVAGDDDDEEEGFISRLQTSLETLVAKSLREGDLVVITPLFLILGLLLSFTPCVLPMVPILSSIIVGEGAGISRARGFALSAAYALGMALVYTSLGVAAGLLGEGLAARLQNPWVLGTFGVLMVALALSMFDVYQLQVPSALQSKLSAASDGQRKGRFLGVFVMGAISALIVGPCVAGPLAGALVYISQTRNVVVGGAALFSMAMGMSVPLLLVGLSAGSLLPRAGRWMENVKKFFGVLMLAVAIWLVSPVLPVWAQMAAWGTLFIAYAAYLLFIQKAAVVGKTFALVLMIFGAIQWVGLATGAKDVFSPLAHLRGEVAHEVHFKRIKNIAELEQELAQAKAAGKVVMLDFYADWCVSCIEMEKLTFPDPKVSARMNQMVLLQADVTANNSDDKALLKRFGLYGPPGIIFWDVQGQELSADRVIGFKNAKQFNKILKQVSKH